MPEQLSMPWGGDKAPADPAGAHRRPAAPDKAPRQRARRGRPGANRPVRGEPDLPGAAPFRGEWRLDGCTRTAGLQGIARARAALEATRRAGGSEGRVHAA